MVTALNVGSLNREFWFQQPSGENADFANIDAEPTWGSIRYASGSELLRFGTPAATGSQVVTIRYRDDVRASWRLVEADSAAAAVTNPTRVLQIVSVGDPDGSEEQLQIFCVETL